MLRDVSSVNSGADGLRRRPRLPHIGRISSCNLGSMNIAKVGMDSGDIGTSVEGAIRGLTAVSEMST